MRGQSKKHSMMEASVNVLMGYWVALAAHCLLFPLFNINLPMRDNFVIGGLFTVVGIVLSYVLRRLFNWWHVKTVKID